VCDKPGQGHKNSDRGDKLINTRKCESRDELRDMFSLSPYPALRERETDRQTDRNRDRDRETQKESLLRSKGDA